MAPTGGQQIDEESEHVEGEDQSDDPFEDGRDVLVTVCEGGADEDDRQTELDEDEEELHPKGDAQDAMLAEVDTQALILGADENGGDDIAGPGELLVSIQEIR